jgi:2-keto-4-pentenoate hydratase/2-oxohepta-3-ene-1,7-dioic acid hydratase in catechol pathway
LKFASFVCEGVPGYGLVEDDFVRPVPPLFLARHPDLRSAIAAGALAAAAAAARANPRPAALAGIRFLPVVPNPGKILCVGVNYLAHMKEMGREPPAHPFMFVRFPDSLVGHGRPLVRPLVSDNFDFEGELAVVVGRRARYVEAADALAYAAGYSCFNDGSIRDFQHHSQQVTAGKNFPSTGSFGPWLVTVDEVPDPRSLHLQTRLNGRVMQDAPVADMRFGVADLIAYCSRFVRLEPGDVISTGTPSGVGYARKPQVWMRPGDVLEVEIGGIGVLRNDIVAEQPPR